MPRTPAGSVGHTSRRIVSAFAGFAVALTMARFGFDRRHIGRIERELADTG